MISAAESSIDHGAVRGRLHNRRAQSDHV